MLPRFLVFLSGLLTLLAPISLVAQSNFYPVKGLPTNEVFDLLVDKKGYLWIGHDMGISRYDGVAFTHFAHPQRSSLSCADLVEDPHGRIWFHNFTGQVFFIENERVNWVTDYQNEKEEFFPRLVSFKNEIIVSSIRGLFICDVNTLKSRYVTLKNNGRAGTRSLAVTDQGVIGFNANKWFMYTPEKGLNQLSMAPEADIFTRVRNLVLQPKGIGDTALMLANPSGMVYSVYVHNQEIRVRSRDSINSFINNLSSSNKTIWVNGKDYSFPLGNKRQKIEGYNISDIVEDRQGNTWISSLTKGLLIAEGNSNIGKVNLEFIEEQDNVTAINHVGNTMLLGTRNGWLYELEGTGYRKLWQYKLPSDIGAVTLIKPLENGQVFISTSISSFLLDRTTRKISLVIPSITKSLVSYGKHLVLASSAGLFLFPSDIGDTRKLTQTVQTGTNWNKQWHSLRKNATIELADSFLWYQPRCRSAALAEGGNLLVSFMNGVHEFSPDGIKPLQFEQQKVYSNALVSTPSKVFVGTLNRGLLIIKGSNIRQINTTQGLFSNSIIQLKLEGNLLWIIQDRGIQILDIRSEKIVSDVELPQEHGSNVYDVGVVLNKALLATSSGLYELSLRPSKRYGQLQSELKLIIANRSDTIKADDPHLSYDQNDLQFHVSVPWYNPSNNLYFKYRLIGENSAGEWYSTQPGERIIRFASLMPGSYTFESYAVVAGFQERVPVRLQFTIARPWWKTNLFTIGIILAAGGLFFVVYRFRVAQVLQLEQVRRTISSDLHDEIGSTISSINIYSELAKAERDNEPYLNLIQENTRDVINKLDDLVWSINPKNDSMEQLVARMRLFAEPILAGAGIQVQFVIDPAIMGIELPLARKRNLYLMFKELVNNVVKHSRARTCVVELNLNKGKLSLFVKDDGIGIANAQPIQGRSGMFNLRDRATYSKASFVLQTMETGGTLAAISMPVK